MDEDEEAICGVDDKGVIMWATYSVICLMVVAGVVGLIAGCMLWEWLSRPQ
ncbi:MAG: hypothetical protein KJ063_02495 [Anaerolineae bacterium]|nr:hypothetical protein [Anaerolineae bacterium]